MTSSFEVANFIIEQLESKQETLSGMALQRYIFLLNGAHIMRHGEKLITEDFTVGQYGPLVKVLNEEIPERGGFIQLIDNRHITKLEVLPDFHITAPLLPKDFEYRQELIDDLNHIIREASPLDLIEAFSNLNLKKEYGIMFQSDIRNFFAKNPAFQIWNA